MSEKFQNRYRIPSARLQNWDYGRNAAYFITICTQNRECYFEYIQNGNMVLSEIGNLANRYWHDIPIHFPFVKLGEFIVMPNHIHGIIIIDHPIVETPDPGVSNITTNDTYIVQTPDPGVSITATNDTHIVQTPNLGVCITATNDTHIVQTPDPGVSNGIIDTHATETPKLGVSTDNRERTMNASEKWKPATVGVIVNQYKRFVTIHARKINAGFEWQSRFFDHIIRNNVSYQRIADYIVNNPVKWNNDNFFIGNT
jgi:putative transposase